MSASKMYHPSIFKKPKDYKEDDYNIKEENAFDIPENTLYEEPVLSQKNISRKGVTIFGYSPANYEAVIRKVKECGNILQEEYGKNWILVVFGTEESVRKCLKMNTTSINGEIIGVYRQTHGIVEDEDIFVRKKGLISNMLEYLFG